MKSVAALVKQPLIVLVGVLTLLAAGLFAASKLDVEAYPNPVPPMIEVVAQPNGMSAEEVEKYVTVPLEVGLAGMPGLEHVRTQSIFGLADVKCYFSWGTEYARARQEVINRLQFVGLPNGVAPELTAANATGEIFRYTLSGKGYSLMELKTAQDFTLERQFRQVPGVADVVSFGGESKQYHVSIDPTRLRAQGATLGAVVNSLAAANQNVGGQRLTLGAQSYDVRGVGLLRDVKDVENVVVIARSGTPVRVRDVATVEIGPAPRLGTVGRDDDPDVIQGVIVMRFGSSTADTLEALHARIALIQKNHLLPPGMSISSYYDRGNLVHTTVHTVRENLAMGMLLVAVVLFLFLGNARAAIIATLCIPLALLAAFLGLVATGTSANLLSLGAIDFGIVVDSAVIMTESIFRRLGHEGKGTMVERISAAVDDVKGPIGFGTLVIGVSFIPLYTMTGVSGVIFSPMARTYAFAIGGALVLAFTMVPTLGSKWLKITAHEEHSKLMTYADRVYAHVFRLAVKRPWIGVVLGVTPLVLAIVLSPKLGKEFMPKLEEGNIWIRASLPVSISREASVEYANSMRSIIRGGKERKHPMVTLAVSQVGRPDDGTDVTGFNNIEIFAPLAPLEDWPKGATREQLLAELSDELEARYPGITFNFSQMISDNVEEAVAGVKGENCIKVFGPDIVQNEKIAGDIESSLAVVKGIEDLGFFHSLGQPNVRVVPNRESAARYGLNSGDVLAAMQAAIGGQAATRVYEGDKQFELTVRFRPESRETVTAVSSMLVATPDGQQIPLGQIAAVEMVDGPQAVYREEGRRYTPVKFSVRGRDLAGAVEEARAKVQHDVQLPYEVNLEWTGELSELQAAQRRLVMVVPLTVLLIALLVYFGVGSRRSTFVVLANIPIAGAGGILALLITGSHLSISAAMGFVSILGIAVQDALLIVTYFTATRANHETLEAAVSDSAARGLRPALMTALVAMLGLFPAALSHGIGSETQKPLAIVVIGGAASLLLASRVVQPALLMVVNRKRGPKAVTSSIPPPVTALVLLIAGAIAFAPSIAHAQAAPAAPAPEHVITVDSAMQQFRAHGYDLLVADARIRGAEADIRSASAVRNPALTPSGGRVFNYDPKNTATSPCEGCSAWQLGIGVTDSGAIADVVSGKRGLRRDVAEYALRAARLDRQDAERLLTFQVKSAVVQLASARAQLLFAKQAQRSLTKLLELNRARYPGSIDEGQLARVEREKLEQDNAVDLVEQDVVEAQATLSYLLGLRAGRALLVADTSVLDFAVPAPLQNASEDKLVERAMNERADVKGAQNAVPQAESAIDLARRERVPDVQIAANYTQTGTGQNAIQPPTLTLGLTIPLPIFYQQQGEVGRAQADADAARITYERTVAQANREVRAAWSQLEATRKVVERTRGGLLDRARRAKEITEIQFKSGATPLMDLLDAQRSWIATNNAYLASATAYWIAVYQLEAAVGGKL